MSACMVTVARMWPSKTRDEAELLGLFEASGRNVEEAATLLRDLLATYPDRPELAIGSHTRS